MAIIANVTYYLYLIHLTSCCKIWTLLPLLVSWYQWAVKDGIITFWILGNLSKMQILSSSLLKCDPHSVAVSLFWRARKAKWTHLSVHVCVCVRMRCTACIWNLTRRKWIVLHIPSRFGKYFYPPISAHWMVTVHASQLHDLINNASGKHITIKAWQLGRLHP